MTTTPKPPLRDRLLSFLSVVREWLAGQHPAAAKRSPHPLPLPQPAVLRYPRPPTPSPVTVLQPVLPPSQPPPRSPAAPAIPPLPPGVPLGIDVATGKEVVLSSTERPQGIYSVGVTGTGKTTFELRLMLHAARSGVGFALVEPHGDLTRAVIAGLPEHRLKDVVFVDLTDGDHPVGINCFQCDSPDNKTEVAKVASFVMHVFSKVWMVSTETPRLQQVLRNITRTLIENPGMTFAEIPLLLWDETAREKLVSNVTNTQTRLFWQQYNRKSPREKDEFTSSTTNKADSYLNEPLLANVVSQSQTTLNFRQIMDEGKILLLNLSPQLEEASHLLGALLLGRLLMAAYARATVPESQRREFHIYVDEFQRFATDDFSVLISEARKFKVIIGALAHQTLEQLSDANRAAALQAGTLVVFRVTGDDAKDLSRAYNATPTQEQTGVEPLRAPVTDVVTHLVRRGHVNPRVSAWVAEYLIPLETSLQKVRGFSGPFQWGCTLLRTSHVIEGRRLVNDVLFQCMQTGQPDGFIPPLALFVLGGAADDGSTRVFFDDIKRNVLLSGPECLGFYQSANRFGQGAFLEDQHAVADLLKKHAKKKVWDDVFLSRMVYPGPAFIRMLRSLRETMAILAAEPVMVDTGQYQPVYRQRTYQDMENEIANSLSQLPNYHARVKLLTGEHTIRTHPAAPLLPEAQINERIAFIKKRMREQGYCKPAHEVAAEVARRHEALRQRPHSAAPPPASTNGRPNRRRRPRPPGAHT